MSDGRKMTTNHNYQTEREGASKVSFPMPIITHAPNDR